MGDVSYSRTCFTNGDSHSSGMRNLPWGLHIAQFRWNIKPAPPPTFQRREILLISKYPQAWYGEVHQPSKVYMYHERFPIPEEIIPTQFSVMCGPLIHKFRHQEDFLFT